MKHFKPSWKFIGSHYKWGTNGSDTLWVAKLPRGQKVYCWGWEANPNNGDEGYTMYFSLIPPAECWGDDGKPEGYDLPGDVEVFYDLYEVLEHLGYDVE